MVTVATSLNKLNTDKENFVVMVATMNHVFAAYESLDSFVEFLYSRPINERYFHEIINDGEQKFHLDIDGNDSYALLNKRYIINQIYIKLCDLYRSYKLVPDFIVYETPQPNKMSYHIIDRKYRLTSYKDCNVLCGKLIPTLDKRMVDYLDTGIYKKMHFLRMPLCSKYKVGIPKRVMYPKANIDFKDGLVTYLGNTTLCTNFKSSSDLEYSHEINKEKMSSELVDPLTIISQSILKFEITKFAKKLKECTNASTNDGEIAKIIKEAIDSELNTISKGNIVPEHKKSGIKKESPEEFIDMINNVDSSAFEETDDPIILHLKPKYNGYDLYCDSETRRIVWATKNGDMYETFIGNKDLEVIKSVWYDMV